MILIYIVIIIITAVYLLASLLLYLFQAEILYKPSLEIFRTPGDESIEFEDLDLHTEDGISVNAWYISASEGRGELTGTVLFCHGNAGSMSHRIDTIKLLHETGFNIMMFDYRGYGISEGSPSEQGTYLDALAALDYLINEKKIKLNDIIVWGRSLGGPVAAKIAENRDIRACVLESTFTSVPDVAKWRFRLLPAGTLTKYSYSTIDYVADIKAPVLVVHSRDDEIIPYRMGRKIFDAISGRKSFLELRGSHNDCYFDCTDLYLKGLNVFFQGNSS